MDTIRRIQGGKPARAPYKTVQFLENFASILEEKIAATDAEQLLNTDVLRRMLQWRVVYLISEGAQRIMSNLQQQTGTDKASKQKQYFDAWNDSQVYLMADAARAYFEVVLLEHNLAAIQHAPQDSRAILQHMMYIYALSAVARALDQYLEGEYINAQQSKLIRQALLQKCRDLVPDGVSLIDALAAPDAGIWSPFGQADGQVYKRFHEFITSSHGCYERAPYWKLLRTPIAVNSIPAAL